MFQFTVSGMTCGGCARRVTNAILSVDPVAEITTGAQWSGPRFFGLRTEPALRRATRPGRPGNREEA